MADEIIITGREAASVVVDTSGIPAIVADFPVEQNLVADTVYVQGVPGSSGGDVSSVAGRTGAVVLSSADLTDVASLVTDAELSSGLATKANTSHTHAPADITGTAVITTDPRLSNARTPTAHTHTASEISNSTATGRSVLTAADAAAARTAIGAGTSNLAIGTTGTTAAAGNRQATETAIGMVELATTTETTTGTDTTRAVTPAGLKAVADTKAPALGADDNYVTDAEKTKLANLSGTNTGDQDLSGYVQTTNAPELIRDTIGATLVAGSNVTITPDDVNDTITIAASGGVGGVGGADWAASTAASRGPNQLLSPARWNNYSYDPGWVVLMNRIFLHPLRLYSGTYTRAGAVMGGGVTGSGVRVGLYERDPNTGAVGSLLFESGFIPCEVAGLCAAVIDFTPTASTVYLAIACQGTAHPKVATIDGYNLRHLYPEALTGYDGRVTGMMTKPGVTGAFPTLLTGLEGLDYGGDATWPVGVIY